MDPNTTPNNNPNINDGEATPPTPSPTSPLAPPAGIPTEDTVPVPSVGPTPDETPAPITTAPLAPGGEPPKALVSDEPAPKSITLNNGAKKPKTGLILTIILIVVIVLGGGYFAYAYWQSQQSGSDKTQSNTKDQPKDTAPVDPTADWTTYSDPSVTGTTLAFKYPADWTLKTQAPDQLTGTGTSSTITSPDGKVTIYYYNGVVDGLGGVGGDWTFTTTDSKKTDLATSSDIFGVTQYNYQIHDNQANTDTFYVSAAVWPKTNSVYPLGPNTYYAYSSYTGETDSTKTQDANMLRLSTGPTSFTTAADANAFYTSDTFKTALQILQSFTIK